MQIFDGLTYINKSSLALGFFDGLHLGHNVVLKNAINIARENGVDSTVITFKTHPLNVLTNDKVEQILTMDEKISLLEKIGIDNLVLLDFEQYSYMPAKEYIENVLIKFFSPTAITTGYNHSFGFNKEGNSSLLEFYSNIYKYKYFEIPPFVVKENIVSCSVIRNMIHLGNFQDANELLGYRFFINGVVVKGSQLAGKIGYPSANVIYPEDKIKIPHGVYFVKVHIAGVEYNGVLNHGYAPTLDNTTELKTEVHIIDFNKDIYGENIKIEFIAKIRNQLKFENTEKLKAQILRDIAFTSIYKHFLNSRFSIGCKHLYL